MHKNKTLKPPKSVNTKMSEQSSHMMSKSNNDIIKTYS